ncbi:MAG: hypothetical protein ACK5UO_01910, partial [Microcystis sp.]|uniref:hypothetical protein n=1 Tax=Microcystis sp. TaxID=1127 RepID=UPI00391BF2F2
DMNRADVVKCKDKKKQEIEVEAFNKYHEEEQRSYLQNLIGAVGKLKFKGQILFCYSPKMVIKVGQK